MKLYDLILSMLTAYPQLRNDDKKLIWSVWYKLGYVKNDMLSKDAFMNRNCPMPETIRRTRQKIQETHPELDADEGTKRIRKKIEKEKGTFIYRENVVISKPIASGRFEKRNGIEVWVVDQT